MNNKEITLNYINQIMKCLWVKNKQTNKRLMDIVREKIK